MTVERPHRLQINVAPGEIKLSFDNRHEPLSHYETYRVKSTVTRLTRLRNLGKSKVLPLYLGGGSHFNFEHNGQQYLYAHIRKNASSSFASFLASKLDPGFYPNEDVVYRLNRKLAPTRRAQLYRSECSFFIYRDPIERLVSLFNNKFIEHANENYPQSIIENYEILAQKQYLGATFAEFVKVYLRRYFHSFSNGWLLDAHVIPQADHLWPIHYSHVIRFEHLFEDTAAALGKDVAGAHFSKKNNATSTKRYETPSSYSTVAQLRARYVRSGDVPSKNAYIDTELEEILRDLYAVDYELGSMIGLQGPSNVTA